VYNAVDLGVKELKETAPLGILVGVGHPAT